MIRILGGAYVPKMDLIELQGNIQLADALAKENADDGSATEKKLSSQAEPGDEEVVLGYVERDHLNPKQRTLRIGTLQVVGSRHTFKHPMLVLRACSDDKDDSGDDDHDDAHADDAELKEASPSATASDEPVLFESWLADHPDVTSLDHLFPHPAKARADGTETRKRPREEAEDRAPATSDSPEDPVKDYELVGWIDDKTVFNSKPARVFV